MAHLLEQKVSQVRRRARWLLVLYALGWTLAAVGGAVLALALADYSIRYQDHGIRLMASLAVVLVVAWACYRFWYQSVWQSKLGDVQIARRIERRFPSLTDRLASTIQFLKQPEIDAQAGSAVLRRAVIVETSTAVDEIDVRQVLEPAPAWRALAVGGAVALVACLLAAIAPHDARLALVRLARPLGDDAWPRFYDIAFRSAPTRLAAGQNFEVELVHDAQHRLPEEVRMYYRYETGDGGYTVEVEPMRWVNGAMVALKENVSRPFWYRAEGGDDATMGWIPLEVLEAPRLQAVEITLHPPAYTGLPPEESAASIHALRGTRVELAAAANKPLVRAAVCFEDGTALPLDVSEDGYAVALESDAAESFAIDQTGQYWIELEDREGLIGGLDERYDVRAIPDLEPTVTIEEPGTNIYVTPQGDVPLKIAVKDDLAIHRIALHFKRSDRSDVEDFAVEQHAGPERAPQLERGGLLRGGKLGESRVVEHRWQLAELDLKPGAQLTFWATASDYLPQTGQSTQRQITIITPAELEERLAQRQKLVFAELERVLKMQQDARTQTRSLEIQLSDVGQVSKADVDHAQAAELNQRQVTRTLTSPNEGLPAQIADFLSELHSNRVDSPDIERHMTAILDEIQRLENEHLGTIESELTSFIKAAQAALPREADPGRSVAADAAVEQSLATAARNQDQVIQSLEEMLSELGRWDNYRQFARQITQLKNDQEEIARRTKEASPNSLGREYKDLDEQQQADLRKLGSQQREQSRQLEKIQQQMAEMSQSLAETDPIAAATVADGLHQARRRALSGQMREISQQLEQNQLGQAMQQQARLAADLDELLGILSNRREQELARLVKQLREAEDELTQLRKKQAGLRKKMKDAAELEDPEERKRQLERLTREQKQLEEEAARLARRLERLQAEQAAQSTSSAAGKMADAGQSGQQNDAANAQQGAQAAERDLEEAQQQLAERRQQAEEDLAREQLARLEDSLKGLHERQKNLIHQTERLENLRAKEGRLSRAQLGTLNDLARQQDGLRGETSRLAEKLELTAVIHLALDGAAGYMARASELLEQRETGAPAQGAQEAARLRLAQLLEAFANKPSAAKKGGGGGGSGSSGGSGGSQADGNFALTQLKLLKMLQEDLNVRYRDLTTGQPTDAGDVRQQLADIAAEQGKLAELALELAQPPEAEKPEDDPESLPDLRIDESDSANPFMRKALKVPDELLPERETPAGDDVPPPSDLLVPPPDGDAVPPPELPNEPQIEESS